ncbi:MAG: hypothetical protein ABSB26_03140 [Nitrososphaerales archaeon]|jgi:hypothetical protein
MKSGIVDASPLNPFEDNAWLAIRFSNPFRAAIFLVAIVAAVL